MEELKLALLTGQKVIVLQGIEIHLPCLKRDTQKQRERLAEAEAKKILKAIS